MKTRIFWIWWQSVLGIDNSELGTVIKGVLHVTQRVQNAPQSPYINGRTNHVITPCVDHFGGPVHWRSELCQLKTHRSLLQSLASF